MGCGICMESIENPKDIQRCEQSDKHTFCKPCWEKWEVRNKEIGNNFKIGTPCPSCKRIHLGNYGELLQEHGLREFVQELCDRSTASASSDANSPQCQMQ